MLLDEDGIKTYRILIWGCVKKREILSGIFNKLRSESSEFLASSNASQYRKINDIFLNSELINSKKNSNVRFQLYMLAYKRPPPGNNKRGTYFDWVDDYYEENKDVLEQIFPDTDAIIFVVDAKKSVENHKSFSIKPINQWEQTKDSLRLLKDVVGKPLGTDKPLVIILIYPDPVTAVNTIVSPNTIKIDELKQLLIDEKVWNEHIKIFETPDLTPKISTASFNAFRELIKCLSIESIE